MNRTKTTAIMAAILVAACMLPAAGIGGADATAATLAIDVRSAVIYANDGADSVVITVTSLPAGASLSQNSWSAVNVGDDTDFVDIDATQAYSATVSVNDRFLGYVKTVGISVTAEGQTATATIVVYDSPGETAEAFHFYVKIHAGDVPAGESPQSTGFTGGLGISDLAAGVWIEVTREDCGYPEDWNAMTALQWYCDENGWDCSADYGWIDTLLGLGTYPGAGGAWVYWSQFHAYGDGWAFNNTTLNYITTVEESYIGLLFRASLSENDIPAFPGYPHQGE